MKVFVVIEKSAYEFETSVSCDVYSTRELAKAEWERRVSNALADAEDALNEDEMVVDNDEERLCFDVYKDGEASQWEAEIWVAEKEIDN